MTETTSKKVPLQPKDREHMQRLSEEVQTRLDEMALIVTRTLNITIDSDTVVKFAPSKMPDAQQRSAIGKHIEIICTPEGCGCYVDPPGICEFPCGAAGPL